MHIAIRDSSLTLNKLCELQFVGPLVLEFETEKNIKI